jgi:hypothetical protein
MSSTARGETSNRALKTRTPSWNRTRGMTTGSGIWDSPTMRRTRPSPGTRSATGTSVDSIEAACSRVNIGLPNGDTRASSGLLMTSCSTSTALGLELAAIQGLFAFIEAQPDAPQRHGRAGAVPPFPLVGARRRKRQELCWLSRALCLANGSRAIAQRTSAIRLENVIRVADAERRSSHLRS